MFSFPLSFVAVPFLIIYCIWGIFSLFSLYHVAKFGYVNKRTYVITFAFLALSVIAIFIVYDSLRGVDWSYPINLQLY